MPLGPLIRSMAGPWEYQLTDGYRRIFIDLDDFAELLTLWVPRPRRILEIGCGEGAMTERLVKKYPGVPVTAIDITPKLGRLFRGDPSSVTFSQEYVESVAAREPASYDLAILTDVMHHVPVSARGSLLCAASAALTPNGSLAFKDWIITPTPIHWFCRFAELFITGDRVSYFTLPGIETMIVKAFGTDSIRARATVHPWRNNVALLIQPSSANEQGVARSL